MYRKRATVLAVGLCCLALASAVLAASTYNVDRFTFANGGVPGATSESYVMEHFVIGQAVLGTGHSENYDWYAGVLLSTEFRIYLPLLERN